MRNKSHREAQTLFCDGSFIIWRSKRSDVENSGNESKIENMFQLQCCENTVSVTPSNNTKQQWTVEYDDMLIMCHFSLSFFSWL